MAPREIETLAFGYGLIEGPRVDDDNNLYFSDVPNGGVYRRSPDGEITVAIPKRRGVGGIALHADGGFVVGGRNVCHVKDGKTRVIFEPGVSFNDLMTDSHGRIYCGTIRSDPFAGDFEDQTPGECYRIELDGSTSEVYGGVTLTNGIGFSPDETTIYHADTGKHHLICHDIEDDQLVNRRALNEHAKFFPDGLAVDEAGTIWVADYGNSAVRGLSPTGEVVDSIDVPAKAVTSVCFGGEDRRDLYIVTADNTDDPGRAGTVFRTRADVPGLPVAKARI
ncbi:MAG: D-xylonolactonase [Acidimicrobiales bacterium]|jgi:xylono-1,5-lactonase